MVIILTTVFTMNMEQAPAKIPYSEILEMFNNEQVESFVVEGTTLYIELHEPVNDSTKITCDLYSVNFFKQDVDELVKQQKIDGIIKEYDYDVGFIVPWWVSFLPYLGVIILFAVLWYVMMSRASGGGNSGAAKFSKARTRMGTDEKKKVTFADVAGCEEEKHELQELVDFLKNPGSYSDMGARIPKGVLLIGPPGTGKTLIAKAVAGEAGVQFLSISGSDFVELYVGVGASRVRDLFDQAKKLAPAIIFIDEIDAVGRQRGAGLGGGHDEREQTLNQLLVEMDGFGNNEGVIVMAATNRQDILDSALMRPGRFDRQVFIGLPDIRGREAILRVHSKGKPLGDDVNLNSIARGTPGFSGADLENLLNEAALLAVRHHGRFITMADIDEAILKVQMGPEKKSKMMSDKAKKLTAYHEAGHAIAGKYLENTDPVHYITIIPRGRAGGFTLFRPKEDLEDFNSKSELFENIVMSLGGRVAERLFLGDISTGASGDIQQASRLARAMVMSYGMSDKLGPISFESSSNSVFIGRDFGTTKSYSEKIASEIDEEVKLIFDEAGVRCEEILNAHREQLIGVAEYLLLNETMDGEDFEYYCEHGVIPERNDSEPEAIEPVEADESAEADSETLSEIADSDEPELQEGDEDNEDNRD